jgi:hypothetical protein
METSYSTPLNGIEDSLKHRDDWLAAMGGDPVLNVIECRSFKKLARLCNVFFEQSTSPPGPVTLPPNLPPSEIWITPGLNRRVVPKIQNSQRRWSKSERRGCCYSCSLGINVPSIRLSIVVSVIHVVNW